MLARQDELNVLEAQLERLDRQEARPFFLGTCRGDENSQRKDLLNQINSKLSEYGKRTSIFPRLFLVLKHCHVPDVSIDKCRQALSYAQVNKRDIASLRNWLEGNGSVSQDEISYLDLENDLISLASTNDPAMKQLEDWIEDRLIRYYKSFRAVKQLSSTHYMMRTHRLIGESALSLESRRTQMSTFTPDRSSRPSLELSCCC